MAINLTENSKRVRLKIIEIALSYVGQLEKKDNEEFWDPAFQKYISASNVFGGWFPGEDSHWCAWFCRLVYYQAFKTGNNYTQALNDSSSLRWRSSISPSTINYPISSKRIVQISTSLPEDFWKLVHPFVPTCTRIWGSMKQNGRSLFIPANDVKTKKRIPLPGDLVTYFNDEYPTGSHIGIVYKVNYNGNTLTSLETIEGNIGNSTPGGGSVSKLFKTTSNLNNLYGICRLPGIK